MERAEPEAGPFFVGRERELRTLAASVRDAHAGRGKPLLLLGVPGIGKSRTVEELMRRISLPEDRVLWGRAPEQEGVPAYWPWVQVLRRYIERCDDARVAHDFGPDGAALVRLLPSLRDRLPGLPATPPRDSEQSRFLLFDALVSTLRRASLAEPMIVALEDLHWADESSLLLLQFVADEMRGGRCAILGTCRTAASWRDAALFADLARRCQCVELGGLEVEEVARFVVGLTGVPSVAPAVARELQDATGGNPFFLGEVVQQLGAADLSAAHLDRSSLRPSDGVRAFIRRHLEPLSPAELHLLTVATVLGREFEVLVLSGAAASSPPETLAALAKPTHLRLIEPVESQARFRFTHALIRETLYGELSPATRAQLHLETAKVLERLHHEAADPPIAEIAFHYYHAAPLGFADPAIRYARQAGERAVAQLAYEDGVSHFERALAALSLREPDERLHLGLQLALGSAALRAGDNIKARHAFESALRLARAVVDPASFARAAYGIGSTRIEANSVDPLLIAALDEALAMLDPAPSPQRAALLARLATAMYFTREEERRERLSLEALEMARATGEPTTIAGALITRHLMLWGRGEIADRLRLADEAIELASRVGHVGLILEARTWRLVDLIEQGEIAAAELELDRYSHDAGRTRFPKHRRYSAVVRASLALFTGQFGEAERLAKEAYGIPERRQDSSAVQVYLTAMFHALRETGSVLEVEDGVAEQARILTAAPGWRAGYALVELELGKAERARSLFEELAAEGFAALRHDGNLPFALAYASEDAAWLGDAPRAARLYDLALPFDGRNVELGSPPVVILGAMSRYLGLTAATAGRREPAIAHFEQAIGQNERMGALPQLAHTRLDLARLLAAGGSAADLARARRLIEEARALATRLGMRVLLGRLSAFEESISTAPSGAATRESSATPAVDREVPAQGADSSRFSATCRRDGDSWTIAHGGKVAHFKDAKGLGVLHRLLAHPGRQFHVVELEGDSPGSEEAPSGKPTERAARAPENEDGGTLDAETREAHRERLRELHEDLAEAEEWADHERASRLASEIDELTEELARMVGIGARSPKASGAVERARLNITRSLGRVVRKIAEQNPELGLHLSATVKTGTYCSYAPDARLAVHWEL